MRRVTVFALLTFAAFAALHAQQPLPAGALAMRDFRLQFDPAGTFTLGGDPGWPPMSGKWTINGTDITLQNEPGPSKCDDAARYKITIDGPGVGLDLIADECQARRMILDRSHWLPPGVVPVGSTRRIIRSAGTTTTPLRQIASGSGDWPSFRGREASGISEKQNLPDTWNPSTGENILWRTPIPGLAHSSPIVWGDTIFVTSAISSRPSATFKPGLYGDGDASDDQSIHRWVLYAVDKRTGAVKWER